MQVFLFLLQRINRVDPAKGISVKKRERAPDRRGPKEARRETTIRKICVVGAVSTEAGLS